jgi:hypothetical protein
MTTTRKLKKTQEKVSPALVGAASNNSTVRLLSLWGEQGEGIPKCGQTAAEEGSRRQFVHFAGSPSSSLYTGFPMADA